MNVDDRSDLARLTPHQFHRFLKWSSWEEAIECDSSILPEETDAIVRLGFHREAPAASHCDDLSEGVVFCETP